ASNKPAAIYLIDEPSTNPALKDGSTGAYVQYRYASYVCTLRQALTAYSLAPKVFTFLAASELTSTIIYEINNQMPSTGCPSSVRSMPDWIGTDNYSWKYVSGVVNDAPNIYATYNTYFPPGSGRPEWILAVPSSQMSVIPGVVSDTDLHDRIQAYWEFLVSYPTAPVKAVMFFRYEGAVMSPVSPTDWAQSRALIKFMSNSLLP
ncbi:MAG: hypothetical protein KF686_19705, partial [Ramlibacter sp.]|nr:hypothetical protein [Ramlibacter sp.]